MRPGCARQLPGIAVRAEADAVDAAAEDAVELIRRQLAEATGLEHKAAESQGRRAVGRQGQFAKAGPDTDQDLLIAEGGRLDRQADAVREGHHRGPDRGQLGTARRCGRGAEVCVGPVKLRLGGRGRDGHLSRGLERGGDGIRAAFDLDRGDDQNHRALALEDGWQDAVHLGRRQTLDRLVEQGEVGRRGRENGLIVGGVQQAVHQTGRGAGCGRIGGVLECRARIRDLALQLGLRNAELHQTALFLLDRLKRALPAAGIEARADAADFQAVDHGRAVRAGADEGGVLLTGNLAETAVQNRQTQVAYPVRAALGDGVRVQIGRADPVQLDGGLDAGFDQNAGLGAARLDGAEVRLGPFRTFRDPAFEGGADLGLHHIDVKVADGDEGGPVRTVIGVVEFDEPLAWGGANDVEITDREAVGQALAGGQQGQLRLGGAERGRIPGPLLAFDDAAFRVQGGGVHQRLGDLFAHDAQGRIDRLVIRARQFQLVEGLVKAGRGIGVGAEGQTQTLEDTQQLILGDVGRPVEGHVLHEVGQPQLVLILHQRAGIDAQAQGRLPGRGRIAHDRILHAIGKDTEADIGIGRDVAGRLRPRIGRLDLCECGCGGGQDGDGRRSKQEQTGRTHSRSLSEGRGSPRIRSRAGQKEGPRYCYRRRPTQLVSDRA